MGERKTPQKMLCRNAKRAALSNQRFSGREAEDFRSHIASKIETKRPKREVLKLASDGSIDRLLDQGAHWR
jgi:hypothetical protein